MSWTWDELLEAFRALGGVADNVEQRNGAYGRGVFPRDPTQEARIHVPDNLLIKVSDVEFQDGRIKIKDEAKVGEAEKAFFEQYQAEYSWGADGRKECEAFLAGVDSLPPAVRAFLVNELNFEAFFAAIGKGADRAENRFLTTRAIRKAGHLVLMPVLELVNHSTDGPPFGMKGGISGEGVFEGELLIKYTVSDPFGVFMGWGFPSAERIAFSLPMQLNLPTRTVAIGRDLNEKALRGRFRMPTITEKDGKTSFSHAMIGCARFPKLSKGFFYDAVKNLGAKDPEAAFDSILHYNRTKFLALLAILEDYDGGLIPALRKMARLQLEAMSWCIGTREIPPIQEQADAAAVVSS